MSFVIANKTKEYLTLWKQIIYAVTRILSASIKRADDRLHNDRQCVARHYVHGSETAHIHARKWLQRHFRR